VAIIITSVVVFFGSSHIYHAVITAVGVPAMASSSLRDGVMRTYFTPHRSAFMPAVLTSVTASRGVVDSLPDLLFIEIFFFFGWRRISTDERLFFLDLGPANHLVVIVSNSLPDDYRLLLDNDGLWRRSWSEILGVASVALEITIIKAARGSEDFIIVTITSLTHPIIAAVFTSVVISSDGKLISSRFSRFSGSADDEFAAICCGRLISSRSVEGRTTVIVPIPTNDELLRGIARLVSTVCVSSRGVIDLAFTTDDLCFFNALTGSLWGETASSDGGSGVVVFYHISLDCGVATTTSATVTSGGRDCGAGVVISVSCVDRHVGAIRESLRLNWLRLRPSRMGWESCGRVRDPRENAQMLSCSLIDQDWREFDDLEEGVGLGRGW
jgi:hypothetical protein